MASRLSNLAKPGEILVNVDTCRQIEGHAYAYAQNIPYFPIIDLLGRVFRIEEGDSSEKVKGKLEFGIKQLVGKNEGMVAYIGSLYSLSYQKLKEVSPEFWKSRLQEAIQVILTALAKIGPTVFFRKIYTGQIPPLWSCFEGPVWRCCNLPLFSVFTGRPLVFSPAID